MNKIVIEPEFTPIEKESLRSRLIHIHDYIHGGDVELMASDMEIIADILEQLAKMAQKQEEHSHRIS